jgi:hypothetical protein
LKLPEVISMGNLLVEIMPLNREKPLPQSGIFARSFPGGNDVARPASLV